MVEIVLDSLADDDIEQDGVNPLMHVTFHATIENQLADNDPPEVAETLQALVRQGYSRHEAIHALASVFLEQFFPVIKENRPFDTEAYVRGLKEMAQA